MYFYSNVFLLFKIISLKLFFTFKFLSLLFLKSFLKSYVNKEILLTISELLIDKSIFLRYLTY